MSAAQDWVLQLVGSPWAFVVIAGILVAGAVVVFLPSQAMVVAFGTLLFGRGQAFVPVTVLVVAAAVGMVLGDVVLYLLAKRIDLGSWSLFDRQKIRDAREQIDGRYRAAPARIAVLGRFIPLGRLTTNLVAADSRLDLRRFVLSCVVADVVWAAFCVGIAAATGHWSREQPFLVTTIAVVLSILLGLAISAVEKAIRQRREAHAAA